MRRRLRSWSFPLSSVCCGVHLLIGELLMKGISFVVFLAMSLTLILLPRPAAAVEVTLILRNITTDCFNEWKVSSSEKCTQSTGKIRQDTEAFEQTWEMGNSGHEIRFWWSRLSGEADATVLVNNVVVFRGIAFTVARAQFE